MSFLSFLKQRRRGLDQWLGERGLAHTVSLTSYSVYRATAELIGRVAKGTVLDAGSGQAPYKKALKARGVDVISIDVEDRSGDVTHIADIQNMPVIASGSIDTVICTEVLEHVPRPWDALKEMARVLRPGGHVILSVPHLSPIHEAPHDYFRFTCFGLKSLFEAQSLEVLEMRPVGGLLAFMGHGASVLFLSTVGALPVIRILAVYANYGLAVRALSVLDAVVGMSEVYPCNYVVLARRSEGARS